MKRVAIYFWRDGRGMKQNSLYSRIICIKYLLRSSLAGKIQFQVREQFALLEISNLSKRSLKHLQQGSVINKCLNFQFSFSAKKKDNLKTLHEK